MTYIDPLKTRIGKQAVDKAERLGRVAATFLAARLEAKPGIAAVAEREGISAPRASQLVGELFRMGVLDDCDTLCKCGNMGKAPRKRQSNGWGFCAYCRQRESDESMQEYGDGLLTTELCGKQDPDSERTCGKGPGHTSHHRYITSVHLDNRKAGDDRILAERAERSRKATP